MTETLQRVFYDGDETLRSTGDENSEFFGFLYERLFARFKPSEIKILRLDTTLAHLLASPGSQRTLTSCIEVKSVLDFPPLYATRDSERATKSIDPLLTHKEHSVHG